MDTLNRIQFEILEYLGGWFGFLTTSQIQALTKKKSAGYVREMVGKLVKGGYLRSFRLELSYGVRSENMYTIAPSGVDILQSHSDIYKAVKMPVNAAPLVVRDFNHRASTVWSAIKIWQHLQDKKIPVRSLLFYFDKQGSAKGRNLKARTALYIKEHGTYIPDAIIQTDEELLLIEAYCDRDHQRILSSLGVHAKGLSAGVPGIAYNMNVNAKVLSVFTHRGIMQGVITKLQETKGLAPQMEKLFFFAALDDLKEHGFINTFTNIYHQPLVLA